MLAERQVYFVECDDSSLIVQHLDAFERNEAVLDHLFEHREEGVDLFGAVDYLDDHRQVFGEPQDLCRVQNAVLAEAHDATQDSSAREAVFSRLQHKGFVEWMVTVPIAFADENA